VNFMLRPSFLIHLWTLAGLAFAALAAQAIVQGEPTAAARWLLLVLVVDHTDGTLARAVGLRRRIPEVCGETLDLVTDVIGLTFVPMLFFWKAGVFLPGWGAPLAVAGTVTASLKYAMKVRALEEGATRGAPPVFFSLFLFWLLDLPPLWATVYATGLVLLCWSPVRYPMTSLVTTHWKPGFASLTNYLAFIALGPALLWLRATPGFLLWPLLILLLFHLVVAPVLLQRGVIRPGLSRVY
jgi:phosphatidylserine synthase